MGDKLHNQVINTRTGQSAVTIGGSTFGGILGAPEILQILNAYFPDDRWMLWENVVAVGIATFGGIAVDLMFRILGKAAAKIEATIEESGE